MRNSTTSAYRTTLVLAGAIALTACVVPLHFRRSVLPADLQGPRPVIHDDYRIPITPERVRLTKEYLEIHNPKLAATLPQADDADSIRFTPRMIVVHFTDIPTLKDTIATFDKLEIGSDRPTIKRNGLLNVGIQFVVDRDGTIYDLYPETVIARHVIGLNHVAIGIENVGNGDLDDQRASAPLTSRQLAADIALIRYLKRRYPTIDYLIGHQEYREVENPRHPAHDLFAESRPEYRTEKVDPGRRFLKKLRRALRREPIVPTSATGLAS